MDKTETKNMGDLFFFHSRNFMLQIVLLNSLVLFGLSCILATYVFFPKEPEYWGIYPDQHKQNLTAMMEPNVCPSAILRWATRAVIESYSYDFVEYLQQLNKVAIYFSNDGWDAFLYELKDSKFLRRIIDKKVRVSAVNSAAPVIIRSGPVQGVFSWQIQIPLLLTYESASEVSQQAVLLTLMVNRVSTLHYYRGIGITQFNAGGSFDN